MVLQITVAVHLLPSKSKVGFALNLGFSKIEKLQSSLFGDRAQVVGWPPIRSFRKNSLATSSKNNDEVDGKAGSSALFVKVSMDGAPYLRKVDLKNYSKYQELSSALEKMFSCFTIGEPFLTFCLNFRF